MSIIPTLVQTLHREWQRWGSSTRDLHSHDHIGGVESQPPYLGYVTDYWRVVGEPTWNGATPQPWSAAFVSYAFKDAGAEAGFPYDSGHAGYCAKILTEPATYPGLTLEDPATTAVTVGDGLWAARGAGTPVTYAAAVAALRAGAWFASHCDLVVAVRAGEVDVIGGNVSNSVTMTTYATDTAGHIADHRNAWLAVIKNRL